MVTVTVLSLVVAAISSVIAWRSLRRERSRSDARVAALASAIDDTPPEQTFVWPPAEHMERPAAQPGPALFTAQATASARRRPLLTIGAGLAAVLAVVVVIAMTGDRFVDSESEALSQPAVSLELLSMRSARDGASLAITGLVRNASDEPVETMTATVSAFDRDGRSIGSGSAQVAALRPGNESRFVVTIPSVGGAARYRVSFRDAAGVIRHVDRRAGRASGVL
jgi:hypothetical protein